MRSVKGFALLLSLVLVLILTIFAYWILLLVEKHYAATRMLYDSENARVTADAAATRLVLQHNMEVPRFFSDPATWNGVQLNPVIWNDYRITGSLTAPWSQSGTNWLQFQVEKKRSLAKMELPLRQIRFEDFALFSESPQTLSTATLFDGMVFVREGLTVNRPARFRESVHNDVFPPLLASYRKQNKVRFDFQKLSAPAVSGSLNIEDQTAPFWQLDHYELDLDRLEVRSLNESWEVKYKGITIGETGTLVLLFDRTVHVSQSFREISRLRPAEAAVTLTIASKENVVIKGSVQSLESHQQEYPLLLFAEGTIHVSSINSAIRIDACGIASGEPSMAINPGDAPLPRSEADSWINEMHGSAFVVESQKRDELVAALKSNQKVVWFRGSVGLKESIILSSGVSQFHIEACRRIHNPLSSFPFIEIVEGKKKWQ